MMAIGSGKRRRRKTSLARDLEAWLKDPEFAREYRAARAEIAAVDNVVNAKVRDQAPGRPEEHTASVRRRA
jgi:hypothetical protein